MSEHSPAAGRPTPAPRPIPKVKLISIGLLAALGYSVITHPPFERVEPNQVAVRSNRITGSASLVGEGFPLVLPGVHALRHYALADQVYRLQSSEHGEQLLESSEGMPMSADIGVRYAIDPQQVAARSSQWPDDLAGDLVEPLVREVIARQFALRTVLAIVAEQRLQLKEALETDLRLALAANGFLLRGVDMQDIELPDALADRIYTPERSQRSNSSAPLQTSEGLSIGAEINIRYALDPLQLAMLSSRPGHELGEQLVQSLVQGVIYKQFAQYTVQDIFAGKRHELKAAIEAELQPLMQQDGLVLRSVTMGNIDLPADYRAGMDRLLAAELATRQMEHTLALKAKQVRETELQAEADKVRRDKAAEAAANEQVIAAKAQEEAMKHVLPFKQKQLEQRRLEADADKATRISSAEASADARRIEAAAEADSRRQLADADAYRMDELGKLASVQMERDGALIAKYPLLIQKTMADKLSDKISVIIAPPPGEGGFIGNTLLGAMPASRQGEQP